MIFIDTHNYIKRIYHGGGSPYSLFHNLLLKYADEQIVLVCDGPKSRDYRRSIYANYKSGRNTGDDPVYFDVYNNCKTMALLFPNVTIINMTDGEADDYILARAMDGDTVISNDKDLWPLILKNVKILLNATTKVTQELIDMKFNACAKHITLYKALVGDPSDKIPGKAGYGISAWKKMDYEDRSEYSYMFMIGRCDYDPKFMTDLSCISWKLASPYLDYKYIYNIGTQGDVIKFCEEKGIIL